jgi:hypothetical protein
MGQFEICVGCKHQLLCLNRTPPGGGITIAAFTTEPIDPEPNPREETQTVRIVLA